MSTSREFLVPESRESLLSRYPSAGPGTPSPRLPRRHTPADDFSRLSSRPHSAASSRQASPQRSDHSPRGYHLQPSHSSSQLGPEYHQSTPRGTPHHEPSPFVHHTPAQSRAYPRGYTTSDQYEGYYSDYDYRKADMSAMFNIYLVSNTWRWSLILVKNHYFDFHTLRIYERLGCLSKALFTCLQKVPSSPAASSRSSRAASPASSRPHSRRVSPSSSVFSSRSSYSRRASPSSHSRRSSRANSPQVLGSNIFVVADIYFTIKVLKVFLNAEQRTLLSSYFLTNIFVSPNIFFAAG